MAMARRRSERMAAPHRAGWFAALLCYLSALFPVAVPPWAFCGHLMSSARAELEVAKPRRTNSFYARVVCSELLFFFFFPFFFFFSFWSLGRRV
jgi:hypothetical protein